MSKFVVHWCCFSVFIVSFQQIIHIVLMFLLLTLKCLCLSKISQVLRVKWLIRNLLEWLKTILRRSWEYIYNPFRSTLVCYWICTNSKNDITYIILMFLLSTKKLILLKAKMNNNYHCKIYKSHFKTLIKSCVQLSAALLCVNYLWILSGD